MEDIYFFSQALTERHATYIYHCIKRYFYREVEEIVTGTFPTVILSSNCHCPPSHPVINPLSPSNCIQQSGTEEI